MVARKNEVRSVFHELILKYWSYMGRNDIRCFEKELDADIKKFIRAF